MIASTVEMADDLLAIIKSIDPNLEMKYSESYIGLARNGQPRNFAVSCPKKDWIQIQAWTLRSEELREQLEIEGRFSCGRDSLYCQPIRLAPAHLRSRQRLFRDPSLLRERVLVPHH